MLLFREQNASFREELPIEFKEARQIKGENARIKLRK
jgi:hypothetical protein